MRSFSLEELNVHHEATQSNVSRYVRESDYQALVAQLDKLVAENTRLTQVSVKLTGALQSARDYGSAAWDDWLIKKADKALLKSTNNIENKVADGEVAANALDFFADELVEIHGLVPWSKSVVYAKEKAQLLRKNSG